MCKRAVILAGGQGTRLRPYTVVFPKPLMPIGEYPILEIIIRQLRQAGVERVTLAVNHQANLIQAFFSDGRLWGLDVDYSLEAKPLSTVGPLRLISDLPETFLLMNGDVLTDLSYIDLWRHHQTSRAVFTVASATRRHTVDYGVLQTDQSGQRLIGFSEKPAVEYRVSMGIYVVSRDVLPMIPENRPYGFDHLMTELLKRGERVNVFRHDGYWLDIGRPDDYAQAIDEFARNHERLLPHA